MSNPTNDKESVEQHADDETTEVYVKLLEHNRSLKARLKQFEAPARVRERNAKVARENNEIFEKIAALEHGDPAKKKAKLQRASANKWSLRCEMCDEPIAKWFKRYEWDPVKQSDRLVCYKRCWVCKPATKLYCSLCKVQIDGPREVVWQRDGQKCSAEMYRCVNCTTVCLPE